MGMLKAHAQLCCPESPGRLPLACPWTAGYRPSHLLVWLVCFTACCSHISWLLSVWGPLDAVCKGWMLPCRHAYLLLSFCTQSFSNSCFASGMFPSCRINSCNGVCGTLAAGAAHPGGPPQEHLAHCTSSCSCPLLAQDSQGSRAGHLPSEMQRLSRQGSRAGHLPLPCLWTAGHRPNHLLVWLVCL